MQFKDYYETLDVRRDATQEEIKKAFRKLAMKYHPDVSKEPDAEERFKEINEAHQVLGDPENRKKYDALGANWKQGESFTPPPDWEPFDFHGTEESFGGGAFSDFFRSIFGGGLGGFRRGSRGAGWKQRGDDKIAEIDVSLDEVRRGGAKTIALQERVLGPDGKIETQTHTYDVKIPVGVTEGTRIRLPGQGRPGPGGGPPGDLFLKVNLKSDRRFKVEGNDLKATVKIAPWEAALGAKIDVPTLDGMVAMTIPAGTQGGQSLRLRGKGLPRRDGSAGDLLVTVRVAIPRTLSEQERKLFEQLGQTSKFRPRNGRH